MCCTPLKTCNTAGVGENLLILRNFRQLGWGREVAVEALPSEASLASVRSCCACCASLACFCRRRSSSTDAWLACAACWLLSRASAARCTVHIDHCQRGIRMSYRLVLKLSKFWIWSMGSIPSKSGPDIEGWTTFYLSETSEKGLHPTQGEKLAHELDQSGFLRLFLSGFEQFQHEFQGTLRPVTLDVSSFALNSPIFRIGSR